MKILYLGAESANWVINLSNSFCENGHEVTCIVQQLDEYDKDNPIIEHANLTRINLSFEDILNPYKVLAAIEDNMIMNKYDIVFGSHAPISTVVRIIAETYKLPWGIMLLDIPTDLMKIQTQRREQWNYWFRVLDTANLMVFNTYVSRDEYKNYTNKFYTDEHVVPYAINMLPEYDNAGLNIKGDYVVSICRLTPMKNCKEIAFALSLLPYKLGYIAIGRDRGELAMIKAICKDNNIPFTHYEMLSEKDKFEIIKNSSMLIYPQNTEYIAGLSPLEGMYCGKPVISNDFKVLRDLYGNNSAYYDNTPENLAITINQIYQTDTQYLKHRLSTANTYVKEIATFDIMAKQLIKLMEKVKQ